MLSEKQKWEMMQQAPTEFSMEEIKHRMSDMSPILRRRATDPLPCRMQRPPKKARIRYEDEDEEDCWDQILPGGREETAKLTLEDRLLFPASIRSNHHCQTIYQLFITRYVYRSLSSVARVVRIVNIKCILSAISTQIVGDEQHIQ
jgi:hypothetical protein